MNDDGYAGPSAATGKVFIIDHQGQEDVVRALDFASGKDLWAFRYPDPGGANYGYARATPCFDDGRLYTLGRAGQLVCLNAADGRLLWAKSLQRDFGGQLPTWQYAMSPIIDGDRVVVVPGGRNGTVAVLDKLTGNAIWTGGGSFPAGYAAPVVATINDVKQYVVFAGTALIGVRADNGQLLWQVPWATQHGVNAALPIIDGNFVFASSGYGFGCGVIEVLANGAQAVWGGKSMQAHFSSPVYYKQHIFGTTDPGDLVCLEGQEGRALWRQPGFEKGGIVIVDDAIIALGGGDGTLVMAAAATDAYRELGRLRPLGGQSWTAPIVADGKLLIRNKATLACLDLM
ncbi:MAG: hypothetical protein FJX74_23510 [Armatimonadetes bacterium]|nr:hypothetical protein [Armatimonadota bacterium]